MYGKLRLVRCISRWILKRALNPTRRFQHHSWLTSSCGPQETTVGESLRRDESLKINEILELPETQSTSSELFAAQYEFKITGRIGQLPGKNYVRTM